MVERIPKRFDIEETQEALEPEYDKEKELDDRDNKK
jgi:hypothetical protein